MAEGGSSPEEVKLRRQGHYEVQLRNEGTRGEEGRKACHSFRNSRLGEHGQFELVNFGIGSTLWIA